MFLCNASRHTHTLSSSLSLFFGFCFAPTHKHTYSQHLFCFPFYASVLPLGQQPMSANECKNSYQSAVCTIQPLLPSWCQVTSTSLFLERFKVETLKRLNFSSGWSSDSFLAQGEECCCSVFTQCTSFSDWILSTVAEACRGHWQKIKLGLFFLKRSFLSHSSYFHLLIYSFSLNDLWGMETCDGNNVQTQYWHIPTLEYSTYF